ncbi:Zinc ion binding, partial [Blomia tropicalis]
QFPNNGLIMSAWSQLEQLLTCAICLDRFRNPKLLPCQHTFCGEPCMEGLVDYARRQIKCPECRAEHRIPYNGVQSFPNNVTLTRFLDLHRGITGEEPEPLPSQMDRCGVCGEKSVCVRCAHCEKKVCDECRTAHLDILRREINRINVQVRRGLNKLTEHAQQAGKGSERLLVTSTQIRDEISESVRRFIKDLKDKESKLLADLDEFTQSESKNSEKLNEDLDMELQTISSNCELVEKHVTEDDDWTDLELMEYKEIFLKTLDFLRNMDPDTMDFSRKIKYIPKVDLDTARRNVTDFGEIKITQAPSGGGGTGAALSPSESSTNLALPNSNLMRSQSDHRLAAQFATRNKDPLQRSYLDVTGQGRYGSGLNSDSERERGNSPPGRRGERFGSVRSYGGRTENTGSSFGYTRGWERPGDSEYEPSNSSNFRSRFMRERIRERGGTGDDHSFDDNDSEISSSHRVRFQEEAAATVRPKLFDTEEMVNMRAPLSGLIKLYDSPHVMERLHQNEVKAKLKDAETKENENSNSTPMAPTTISSAPPRPAQRQISEDEIEKQKKQNQAAAAAAQPSSTTTTTTTGTGTPLTPKTTTTTTTTTGTNSSSRASSLAIVDNGVSSSRNATSPASNVTNRRIQAIQKEDARSIRSSNSDDGASSGPESGDVTCDDDTSSMNAPASALNQTTRRRIFASSHSSSSGGEATNGTSASVDYGSVAAAAATEGAGSGRTTKSSSQQQQQPMTATTNRQVSTSTTSTSSLTSTASTPSANILKLKSSSTTTNQHKDRNNNYTDNDPSLNRNLRSLLSPTRFTPSSSSSLTSSSNAFKYSQPSSESTYSTDGNRSSSRLLNSTHNNHLTNNNNSLTTTTPSKLKYSTGGGGIGGGGGGGGGGSAINDYLYGSSSFDNYRPSYDPNSYTSTRLNSSNDNNNKSSSVALSNLTSPTSRHHPFSFTNSNSSTHSTTLNNFNPHSSSTNTSSNWRDHINSSSSSSSTSGTTPNHYTFSNVNPSSSMLNSLLDSSFNYVSPMDSNAVPAIGSTANPNQSIESVCANATDDNGCLIAAPDADTKPNIISDDSIAPTASTEQINVDIASPGIDQSAAIDREHTQTTNIEDNSLIESNKSLDTKSGTEKRTIRIKPRQTQETDPTSTSSSSSRIYSWRDFKGQQKPDYNPYRQARPSVSSGSTFVGIPAPTTYKSSYTSSYRTPTTSNASISGSISRSSTSSSICSVTTKTSPTITGTYSNWRSSYKTGNDDLLRSNITTPNSSTPSATTSTTESATNGNNYRHTLSTMGYPSSSNNHFDRSISSSRLVLNACTNIVTYDTVMDLTDTVLVVLVSFVELSLFLALITLTSIASIMPETLYLHSPLGPNISVAHEHDHDRPSSVLQTSSSSRNDESLQTISPSPPTPPPPPTPPTPSSDTEKSQSSLEESHSSISVSATTSTATLTIPKIIVKGPGDVDLEIDTNSGYGESINNAVPNSPPYYSNTTYGAGRRSSFSRVSTMDDDDGDNNSSGNSYESGGVRSYYNSTTRKPYQLQPSALATHNAQASDRHGSSGSTAAYYRQKLAKSKSSHAIAYDDSDDENNSNNNNPLSPTSSSFRSRFGFSSSATAAAAATTASTNVGSDPIERFASSTSSGRRTSRSGYTYRTREAKEPSPETEDAAGSVTQYLINKYGTRSNSSRPSMLSKSKSSHAIYGRSLSSSDDDTPTTQPTTPLLRRASRDTDSFTFKSSTAYGLTFPRQMYGQKRRMMMKIGSRGTNPGCFTWPRGVACAPDNSIVVADSSNHRVQVFDSTGRFQFEFGSYGSGEGEFDCLAGVTVNRIGHYIVSDRYNHRIQVFDASGRFLRAFGTEGRSDGKFSYPWGISTDALGFIYVCDKENHRIQVFQSDGTFVGKFGSIGSRSGMLEHPHYIAVSNTNRIVVSDSNNHRIQIFDVNGRSLSTFGQEGNFFPQYLIYLKI